MKTISLELSVWNRGRTASQSMRSLLEARFASRNIEVHIHPYEQPWQEIMHTLLYGIGPDVSEVGSTWVRSLAGGNGLRPIGREILPPGKMSLFVCPYWDESQPEIFSVPFLVETRVIFYRRAALAAAGVDESSAFSTPQKFLETLGTLKAHGFSTPLLLPLTERYENLSLASSWVWGAGGEYVSSDGKKALFDQEAVLQGLADYFALREYLSPQVFEISNPGWEFVTSDYPVTMGGPWIYYTLLENPPKEGALSEQFGVALPPGQTYQGGTNLVIWRQTRHPELTAELVQYLTSFEFQSQWKANILPARRDVLSLPIYMEDHFLKVMVESTLKGRSYSNSPLWGVVEDRLSRELQRAWQELLQDPTSQPMDVLRRLLVPLARRINNTLQSN
ncbi:MAG: hypothetical protein DDG60_05545 [Anaerolineae bacterium]|nr:MAG: hypothetical protein DDG60_05545 [Anaerolineae bacterium]